MQNSSHIKAVGHPEASEGDSVGSEGEVNGDPWAEQAEGSKTTGKETWSWV